MSISAKKIRRAERIALDPHLRYVSWMRLTNNGRKSRDQMSHRERVEFDSLGMKAVQAMPAPMMTDEELADAKAQYEAACAEADQ